MQCHRQRAIVHCYNSTHYWKTFAALAACALYTYYFSHCTLWMHSYTHTTHFTHSVKIIITIVSELLLLFTQTHAHSTQRYTRNDKSFFHTACSIVIADRTLVALVETMPQINKNFIYFQCSAPTKEFQDFDLVHLILFFFFLWRLERIWRGGRRIRERKWWENR